MKLALAAAAALVFASPATADVLVDNVNGYTLDDHGALVRFSGLVVDDGGRVRQLLARADKRPDRPTYRVDARGRTLIPGLIDAHGHLLALGMAATELDLSGATSLADAQAKIAAYAAAHPTPRWIIGHGWNQERWGLGHFPTAADIDSIVADRPVWLERVDRHAGWANSLAMKEAGITAKTVSPPAGRVETAAGRPSGVFVDAARTLIDRAVPETLPRARDEAFLAVQQLLLADGVTAVEEMRTSIPDWLVLRRAGDRGALVMRIICYGDGLDAALAIGGTGPTPWLYDGRLRMVGVKFFADGALGSRGAWLKQEYSDAPGQRGTPFHKDAELKNLMSRAAMDGFQVAVHAIGDAANAQVLDAIDDLAGTYSGDRRWRIEHAQIVDPADLPRFAQHGIVASMQPTHATSDWKMAEERLGPDRLQGAYAWATMLQNHVPLAFGSDFPTEAPNPFWGLAAAVSRQDSQDQPAGGWLPNQRISLLQAFAAFTRGAAYAAFDEDRLGTLEPGRMADFLFIDRDIFATSSPDQLRATQVLETWVGGRRVWQAHAAPAAARPQPTGPQPEHR